jgi:hypothetical protein
LISKQSRVDRHGSLTEVVDNPVSFRSNATHAAVAMKKIAATCNTSKSSHSLRTDDTFGEKTSFS